MAHLNINLVYDQLKNDQIRKLFEECFEFGCTTAKDNGNERCNFASEETQFDFVDEHPTGDAIHSISTSGRGSMRLWVGEISFRLQINLDGKFKTNRPHASLAIDQVYISDNQMYSSDDVSSHIDRLLSLAEHLFRTTGPQYGYGTMVGDSADIGSVPGDELLEGVFDSLTWLTIIPAETVENIGRNKVRKTPVEDIRAFDGAIALILTNQPTQYERIQNRMQLAKEHLLST